jgi:CTP:molybdopterin cytidylyltransferase MocA
VHRLAEEQFSAIEFEMISSIVLAAGMSTRMGEPKQLLDWGGEPLLAYQVRQLREAGCDEVIVVLGYRSDDIHRAIRRSECRVMLNPRYQMGRAGSLRIGAKAVDRDAEAIVIINVDQPRSADRIRELVERHDQQFAATRPACDGHAGHPLVVSGWLRPELLEASEEQEGLRGIIRRHQDQLQEIPSDSGCLLDINTRADYEEARRSQDAVV